MAGSTGLMVSSWVYIPEPKPCFGVRIPSPSSTRQKRVFLDKPAPLICGLSECVFVCPVRLTLQ